MGETWPGPATHDETIERFVWLVYFLARGFTRYEAAEEVHLSCRTVDFHIKNFREFYGLRNVAQVVAFCMAVGLIDPSEVVDDVQANLPS